MDSKGKFTKKCGTDFLHQEWGITSGESIKVRRNIPKDNYFRQKIYPTKKETHTVTFSRLVYLFQVV